VVLSLPATAKNIAPPFASTVTVEDSGGNQVTGSGASIALSIASQPTGPAAVLNCPADPNNTAVTTTGQVSFSCTITGPSGPYTLTATDTTDGLTANQTMNLKP
jgi:hypothetical protein